MCAYLRLAVYVAAGTLGYLLVLVLRRRDPGERPFAGLLLGAALVAALAIASGRECGVLGWLTLFLLGMLVIVPGLVRAAEARAVVAGRAVLAERLAGLRALLQPGSGRRREKELRRALGAVGQGQADAHLATLRAELADETRPARLAWLRERILLVLLYDRRFAEAVAEYEATPIPVGTRPLLGASLVRAFCEVGRLDRAAEILVALEEGPAALDRTAAPQLNQARLVLLAYAGCAGEVAELLATGSGFLPSLPEPVRLFWIGTAALCAGELAAAELAFSRARELGRARADQRVVQLSEEGLRRTAAGERPSMGPTAPPVALLRQAAERARLAGRLPRPRARLRQVPVTAALVAVNVAIFGVSAFLARDPDPFTLLRWGANFGPAVAAGERWRLVSSMFLHADLLHIAINAYVLLLLGRLVEQLYGSRRFLVLYLLSGVVGSAASAWGGRGLLSVGASGGIMGAVGGLVVFLLLRRRALAEWWRRSLLVNLLVLVGIQIIVDWRIEFIDNAAHLGGLVGGALLGLVLLPGAGPRRAARLLDALGLGVAAALLVYGAVGVARADPRGLLLRLPRREFWRDAVTFDIPRYFRETDVGVIDPLGGLAVTGFPIDGPAESSEVGDELWHKLGGQPGARRESPPGLAPAGFVETGVSLLDRDPEGGRPVRILVALVWRTRPGNAVLLRVQLPLEQVETYRKLVRAIAESARPAPSRPPGRRAGRRRGARRGLTPPSARAMEPCTPHEDPPHDFEEPPPSRALVGPGPGRASGRGIPSAGRSQ